MDGKLVNQDSSRYGLNADEGEGSGSRNVERPMMHPPSISMLREVMGEAERRQHDVNATQFALI